MFELLSGLLRCCASACVLVTLAAPAFAAPNCGAVQIARQAEDDDTIRRIEQAWLTSEYHGNVDFLDCLLAPGYKVILAKDGSTRGKADLLARVAANRGKDTEVPALETVVALNGDHAIAYSTMKARKKTGESFDAHYVDSYVYENGVWRALVGVDL